MATTNFQRMFLALAHGLLGCLTLGFIQLGCGGIDEYPRVAGPASEDGLKLPGSTLVRLQACADEYAPKLGSSKYELAFTVQANAEGQVLSVKTTEMKPFNRDVAMCIMLTLQAMRAPVSELSTSSGPNVSKSTQTLASRGPLGIVLIPVAVAGLAEIVLVSGAVTVLLAITVSLVEAVAEDIADAIDTAKDTERYCNEMRDRCLETPIQSIPGSLHGSSLCLWCHDKCMGDGGAWPSRVRGTNGKWLPCN